MTLHPLDKAVLSALRERAAAGWCPITFVGLDIVCRLGMGRVVVGQVAERMIADGLITVGADGRVEERRP